MKTMKTCGFFGHDTAAMWNRRSADSPIEKFIVDCESCHGPTVRFRLHCDDGEATLTLVCSRCGETFSLPSKLLDGV